jgi:hypothetical protein
VHSAADNFPGGCKVRTTTVIDNRQGHSRNPQSNRRLHCKGEHGSLWARSLMPTTCNRRRPSSSGPTSCLGFGAAVLLACRLQMDGMRSPTCQRSTELSTDTTQEGTGDLTSHVYKPNMAPVAHGTLSSNQIAVRPAESRSIAPRRHWRMNSSKDFSSAEGSIVSCRPAAAAHTSANIQCCYEPTLTEDPVKPPKALSSPPPLMALRGLAVLVVMLASLSARATNPAAAFVWCTPTLPLPISCITATICATAKPFTQPSSAGPEGNSLPNSLR